jgi:hypothetical protein
MSIDLPFFETNQFAFFFFNFRLANALLLLFIFLIFIYNAVSFNLLAELTIYSSHHFYHLLTMLISVIFISFFHGFRLTQIFLLLLNQISKENLQGL